ncbi:leucyl aminopeptidase [Xanthomonas massiliensis]|uniref:leucyl aminopeptidase n=1 Tax=Xanthomonas massiliensis TaxID=1720302 RepID=UPI000825BFCF|nr:leucyl aminopeptidase [Xanthomonas massiliensis]
MQYALISDGNADALPLIETDCLLVGLHDARTLAFSTLDQASGGLLTRLQAEGELRCEPGQSLLLHAPAGLRAHRLLLIGLGTQAALTPATLRKAYAVAAAQLAKTRAKRARWVLDPDPSALEAAVLALQEAQYVVPRQQRSPAEAPQPPAVEFSFAQATPEDATGQLQRAIAIADGIGLCRDLGNQPANVCTPAYLGQQAMALGEREGLAVEVLDQTQLRQIGMHALLAVGQGSPEPPCLIVFQHWGAGDDSAPLALVGKGVTFDAGGISIKPAQSMDEMKCDMCGGASVFGAMLAAARMRLPINLIGVVAACENMPDGHAFKPSDVIRTLSGTTVEILNTDAEGRLILADALTYVQQRFRPAAIVDIATLTGACVVALGAVHSGLFSNHDGLSGALQQAGQASGDTVWRMPLGKDYAEELDSKVADINNLGGGRAGGAITAAAFLEKFIETTPWAHLDVAGTAIQKGASGRPVKLLCQLLLDSQRWLPTLTTPA